MGLEAWDSDLLRVLKKALDWHSQFWELPVPEAAREGDETLLADAKPVIIDSIREALAYWGFPDDEETATVLMYLYPSPAAEIYCATVMHRSRRVAGDEARGIVADANQLGYIGQVKLADLEVTDPMFWREKKLQDYEMLLERGRQS